MYEWKWHKLIGFISTMIILAGILSACSGPKAEEKDGIELDINSLIGTSFENIEFPKGYNIKQFEGINLNFIVENNLYANILTHESEEFSEITGIDINIRAVDFDTLIQKVNLDFISQSGKYELIYVDPYQTLNRFYNYLEVLNPYNQSLSEPKIVGFTDDFIDFQTEVCSYFINKNQIYSIPFDSTTMIFFYRKDIFDQYRLQMQEDLGFIPEPGTPEFTWERYCKVAEWIEEHVPKEEVRYGSGLMAQEHNSIFCEFSNILAAYGGDYFSDKNINTLGTRSFQQINTMDSNFIQALDMYKEVAAVSAPESVNWNWSDTANAFRNGEIAMMANWDENYTYVEDPLLSKVAGNVGYSILPYGDARSGNIYGGSGIGINKYATEIEKKASWLYIVWATSKDMQIKVMVHPEGGSLPTRKSAYGELDTEELSEGEADIQATAKLLKHRSAILNAWEKENIYLRPKTSNFYDIEKVLISHLHKMIKEGQDSREVGKEIYDELNRLIE
ncbi:MAG: extracellular solute-binding protein [Herbinix sp.]|jgi:multiple sugar transport system substrate-binding protein|nr:extracellular solute-binding protein [Herbinix sp.]